ncbi:hypothetical protein LG277_05480 [Vreelandella aquamarina]|uniref:hypothetical protein n=1 Tax=Vreelandella aquamarina TaxID=77097 RepID=UPI00384FD9DA
MEQRKPYTIDDYALVKRKLLDILTCNRFYSSNIIKSSDENEIRNLAVIFEEMPDFINNNWLSAIVGKLPVSSWKFDCEIGLEVNAEKDSSLRLQANMQATNYGLKENNDLYAREVIFKRLADRIRGAWCRRTYSDTIGWQNEPFAHDIAGSFFSGKGDTGFFSNLLKLQYAFDYCIYSKKELLCAGYDNGSYDDCNYTDSKKIPILALNKITFILDSWFGEYLYDAKYPESVLALVSMNLSANRLIIELSEYEELSKHAFEVGCEVVRGLGSFKWMHFYAEKGGIGSVTRLKEILKKNLTALFGKDGSLVNSKEYFDRVMQPSEIEIVANWSHDILKDLKLNSWFDLSNLRHLSMQNNKMQTMFLISLCIAGAFYSKSKVKHEFFGNSTPYYSVFPGRINMANSNGVFIPRPHALNFILLVYKEVVSLINDDSLSLNELENNRAYNSLRRGLSQQLISFAVKNRTSGELKYLDKKLSALKNLNDIKLLVA